MDYFRPFIDSLAAGLLLWYRSGGWSWHSLYEQPADSCPPGYYNYKYVALFSVTYCHLRTRWVSLHARVNGEKWDLEPLIDSLPKAPVLCPARKGI
jgi:hypothetical protein